MILYFGKHRGEEVEDVPSNYLKWLQDNSDDEKIVDEATEEYQRREENYEHFWEN